MVDHLKGFTLDKIIYCGQDGFPGTSIELGMWHGRKTAVKYGIKQLHEHEALILSKIGYHPNIIQLIKAYEFGDCFIVLEGIENGLTLERVLERNTKMPLLLCVQWLLQLASAIKHIHNRGIIHHDIKSSNVLVSQDHFSEENQGLCVATKNQISTLKICDFELSVESEHGLKFQGSNKWMAPEVMYADKDGNSHGITNKIDVYAFGLLFIDLVCCGRDSNTTKYLCPVKIFNLMYQCISANPDERPSIDEVIEVLSQEDFGETILDELKTRMCDIESTIEQLKDLIGMGTSEVGTCQVQNQNNFCDILKKAEDLKFHIQCELDKVKGLSFD